MQECTTYYGNPPNKLFHMDFKFQIVDKMGRCSQFNFNDSGKMLSEAQNKQNYRLILYI